MHLGVARSQCHHDVVELILWHIPVDQMIPFSLLSGFLVVPVSVVLAIVAPIQAGYRGVGSDRVLAT